MKWTIGRKLGAGFGICAAALASITIMLYFDLSTIGEMEKQSAKRATDVEQILDAANAGTDLYRVVADAVINRDLDESAKLWTAEKKKSQERLATAAAIVDTETEKADVAAADAGLVGLVNLYEKDLLPLLKDAKSKPEQISEIDGKIDGQVEIIQGKLAGVVQSLQQEAKDASQEFRKEMATAKEESVAFLVAGILAALICAVLVSRGIVRATAAGAGFAEALRRGDLSTRTHSLAGDELGDLCRALDKAADSLEAKAAVADRVAQGDLTAEVTLASEADRLGNALQTMIARLGSALHGVQLAAGTVTSGSEQISSASQALSQGATESAASLEEITASIQEIGGQTKRNAESAGTASRLAQEARAASEKGNTEVGEMSAAMKGMQVAGAQISKVVKLIDDIAFQTNLLALNAAVEAARAGRHGKGFAVVADEVRSLAGRSAKAAKETADLVEGTVKKVESGNQIASRLETSLGEITGKAVKVADLLGEIAAASNEQAQGVTQISQGLAQIDQVTQQNTASAEETASAAQELAGQAVDLQKLVANFRLSGSETTPPPSAPPRETPRETPRLPASGGLVAPKQTIDLDDKEFGKY